MHTHQLIFVFIALWTFILVRLAYDEWQQYMRFSRRRRMRRRRG
jgi:uncharacterized membrane protein YidH (DUF202 family)